jgi:Cytochrome c7 and related cytochrome c
LIRALTGGRVRGWLRATLLAFACFVGPLAFGAPAPAFDHFTTSFELTGQHKDVACEACHVGGIFKGTPHECVSCHMTGSRIGATAKPTTHILSSNDCAACHSPSGWKPVARFNHLAVLGSCSSCHNNVQTVGKTATHIPTTEDCGNCHLPTVPWQRASFAHTGITGDCARCHNGVQAPGKPTTPVAHLPTTAACETCHAATNFKTWSGTKMVHAGIATGCQSCHETGMSWFGVTMVDRPTAAQDPAHPTAAQAPDCASCHSGFNTGDFSKVGKPAGHLLTSAPCMQCHTAAGDYKQYVMGATGHKGITSGCQTCHAAGLSFLGIAPPALVETPSTHLPIPSGEDCSVCHSTTSFATGGFGPSTPMNHAGITSGCQTCHETGMAWKGVTMVDRPTPAQDAAHPTAAQGPDCATCHQGFNKGDFNKNAKPLGHIPTAAACAQCHTSLPNFAIYAAGTALHTGITSGCATCHAAGTGPWAGVGGLTFTIKQPPANHLPVNGRACEACHSPTSVATGGFGPSTAMNHAGITSGCQSCHETGMSWFGVTMVDRPTAAQDAQHPTVAQGADCAACHATTNFAVGGFNIPTVLPVNHMPASLNCANCHKAIPTWSSYVMGASGHSGITSGCANCHAAGKSFLGIAPPALVETPPTHLPIPSGDDCSTCHSTTSFATGGFGPSTPMNHAGITSGCQTCHETGMAWKGVTMVDRPTPAQDAAHPTAAQGPDCATCHQGFNTGDFATNAKPLGHIPTAAACLQCHQTPGNLAVYTAGTALHTGITSGCATCHAAGTGPWAGVGGLTFTIKQPPANHLPVNGRACEACHSPTSVATNGFGPSTAMNHAGITSGCQSCHETGMSWFGVTMVDRPTAAQDAQHPTVAQGADCAACHSTTNFAVGGFNIPTVLPANHMPASLNCANCHKAIPTWSSYVMGASGHSGITSGCANCHAAGKSFLGIAPPALVEPPTTAPAHLPIPAADGCEACHSTTSFATGGFGPSTPMNHAGITSGCQTCHETGMAWKGVTMVDRPTSAQDPNHVTAAQTADCSTSGCHSGFNVGDFNKVGKPTGHIPTTAACTQCHQTPGNYAVYTGGTALHTGITSGCATCHAAGTGPWAGVGGLTFTIKQPPANHLPVNGRACETCHSPTSVATNGFGPSTAMNHAGITSGCQSCHETGMSWYGVTMVDRPTAAQDPNHVTAAQVADCATAGCHSNSNFAVGAFNIVGKPTGHIPTTAACSQCHTTPGNYAVYTGGATLHKGIVSGCKTCHGSGTGPWAGVGGLTFTIKQPPANHIPIGSAACEGCHSITAFTTFGNTPMKHAPVSGMACKSCHEYTMRTANYWYGIALIWHRDSQNHHGTQDCGGSGCHNTRDGKVTCTNNCGNAIVKGTVPVASIKSVRTGGSGDAPAASTGTAAQAPTTPASGPVAQHGARSLLRVPGGAFDHQSAAGAPCASCHNGSAATGKGASHPATSDYCAGCHVTIAWRPVARVDHAEVKGACRACHDGVHATGKRALHVQTGADCDTCHTSSAWKPAVFDHVGVLEGTCLTCHGTGRANAKPLGHPATMASCDSCHYTLAWRPVRPPRDATRKPAPPSKVAPPRPRGSTPAARL